MGREPTAREIQDFIKDLQEDDSEEWVKQQPGFHNPIGGMHNDNQPPLPKHPYTADDAIRRLKRLGYHHPTDE